MTAISSTLKRDARSLGGRAQSRTGRGAFPAGHQGSERGEAVGFLFAVRALSALVLVLGLIGLAG